MKTPNPAPETPTPLGLLPLPPTPLTNKLESEFEQAEYTNAVCKLFSHAKDLERALAEAKRENEGLKLRIAAINGQRNVMANSVNGQNWAQYWAADTRMGELVGGDYDHQLATGFTVWRINEEMKAEIERLKAERQWQPIETAPRDGTMILGFSPDWLDDDYNPSGIRLCFYDGDDKWRSAFWENTGDCFDTDDVNGPTLWMPLPTTTQEGQG